jgi:hypothetical protein
MVGRFWFTARIISAVIQRKSARIEGRIKSDYPHAKEPREGNCQIGKSGSGRRKGARIDLLVGLTAVQFDKIDQHQPVRRLAIVLRLGKQGALVW